MAFGPASQLGVSLYEDTPPVEMVPGRSAEETERFIPAVYRQILGTIVSITEEV